MTTSSDYQARLGLTFAPSAYQSKIFDWIVSGRGNAVAEAVAGSGKTTTIVAAARLVQGQGMFLAFNKSIAKKLEAELDGTSMISSTIHSHGLAAIRFAQRGRSVKVDRNKYHCILDAIESDQRLRASKAERDAIADGGFPRSACLQLCHFARLALIDDEDADFDEEIHDLADKHSIDFAADLDDLVPRCVRRMMSTGAMSTATIDFTDMVWIPWRRNWTPRRYSWIFVDECQDLSAAALALVGNSVRPGGRVLFVGDRQQAIYGFAGADADSFSNIIDVSKATILPLSVCYRCPTSVLDRAREYCPQIEARPGAPKGVVRDSTRAAYVAEAREGDMVLCRRTAPLIGLCFELIAAGMPAAVRGRKIGEGLVKVARKVEEAAGWSGFLEGLNAWTEAEKSRIKVRYKDQDRAAEACEMVDDQAACLRVILARSEADSLAALERAIADIFSDDRESVTLSTIHRAKGLEAQRVVIMEAERLGTARKGAQEWVREQERNLAYVAITRAKEELIELVAALPPAVS